MKKWTLVGLALMVAGAGIISGIAAAPRGRRRWGGDEGFRGDWIGRDRFEPDFDRDWAGEGDSTTSQQIESAPVLEIRGALDEMNISAGEGERIGVTAAGRSFGEAVHVRRSDDGSKVVLNLLPR